MKGLPTILAERREADRTELDLEVPAAIPWFEGHFPGTPVLPGVVLIGWAVHHAHTLHGLGPAIAALEQVKFKRPVLPGARLTLVLKPDAAARKLRYEYRDAAGPYSSGTLVYGAGP